MSVALSRTDRIADGARPKRSEVDAWAQSVGGRAPGVPGIELRLDNKQDLAFAFGDRLAAQVLLHIRSRLGECSFLESTGLEMRGDSFSAPFSEAYLAFAPSVAEQRLLLEELLVELMACAVEGVAQPVRPLMSGAYLAGDGQDRVPALISLDVPVCRSEQWARSYRLDMQKVSAFMDSLLQGASLPCWRPVCHASNRNDVLFYELFICDDDKVCGGEGADVAVITALERTGFQCVLEHQLVKRAIEELEAFPHIAIGVKISSRSVGCEALWASLQALVHRPALAVRLIIMLDEADTPVRHGAINRLAAQIRQNGCRLALTSFGVAGSSIASLVALRPDIVKIDGFFVRYALISPTGREMLQNLVGLVGSIARHTVLEGVDTEACAELGQEAGASWQQGHHLGCSSIIRPWPRA